MMCHLKKWGVKHAAFVLFLLSGLAVLIPIPARAAQSVTLGWEQSADPSVVGYNIYYGIASHVYTNKVSVGNVTMATISGLVAGTTYYFAATTYDASNQESAFSDEITYTVPLPATNQPPPATGPPTNNTVSVGQDITFSVTAAGTAPFTYSLAPGAPAGASIDPASGLFDWSPGISQAGTTNVISVVVTDSSSPPMTTTQTFTLVVQDYVGVSIGSTVVATNSAGALALSVYASTPITNLAFTLNYSPGQLTNFSLSATNALLGTASATPIAPGQTLFTVGTSAGQSLLGSQALGEIGLQTLADQKSAFAYLQTTAPVALKADGTLAANVQTGPGRVTIVGQESLVEAQCSGGTRTLIVYGPVGAGYQVESCNVLGAWSGTTISATMTNLCQTFQLPPDTNAATFYRTLRTQ
jgi:hypothetical protein